MVVQLISWMVFAWTSLKYSVVSDQFQASGNAWVLPLLSISVGWTRMCVGKWASERTNEWMNLLRTSFLIPDLKKEKVSEKGSGQLGLDPNVILTPSTCGGTFSLSSMVLNWGWFWQHPDPRPHSWDIWQSLETLLAVIKGRVCYRCLADTGHGRFKASYNERDSPTTKKYLAQDGSGGRLRNSVLST